MSYWIGGSMILSAYSSNKASKENSKGIQQGLNQSAELAGQARRDVMSLFDMSSKKANISTAAALDFYKQNAMKRMQPFIQGNQAAQNAIGLGARQANNAILGLPVDMGAIQQPQVQADYSGIMGANLPQLGKSFAENEAARVAEEQATAQPALPNARGASNVGGLMGGTVAGKLLKKLF